MVETSLGNAEFCDPSQSFAAQKICIRCIGAWMGQKISAKQLKTSEGIDSSCAKLQVGQK